MPKSNEQRQRASDNLSRRYAVARGKAVEHCADFFAASGVEYTCLAVVENTVQDELNRIAVFDEYKAYNVNSRNNLKRVADLVHERWKASTKGCPGHVARYDDPKRCRLCGTHVDELRD